VTSTAKIAIEAVSKTFETKRGRPHLAISDISLKVADGDSSRSLPVRLREVDAALRGGASCSRPLEKRG
jgi:hypothetical protein